MPGRCGASMTVMALWGFLCCRLRYPLTRPASNDRTPNGGLRLSGVILDDELFVYGGIDLFAARKRGDFYRIFLVVPLEPVGVITVLDVLEVRLKQRRLARTFADRDHVSGLHQI